ncbi:MAG TPA: 6-phosphogluconolactonase [Terriglobales bacterium]|nr:6-phosphogluconolactonase [Terriglobales bacterium]
MTNSDREILVCTDDEAVAREAARLFVAHSAAAIQQRGRFAVALSGGSTPKRLYELLSDDPYRDRVDWSLVHFFWGDERFVPSTNQASNYHMTEVALLNSLELNNGNVHRVRTEMDSAEAAASAYESAIVSFFQSGPGEIPRFDLALLGLGTNGHTASLFPHTPLLHESAHLVTAGYIDEVKQSRISFTAPLLNAARNVLFLVTGMDKANVTREVLFGARDPERLPAQLIHPDGAESWLLDRAAAAELPKGSYENVA